MWVTKKQINEIYQIFDGKYVHQQLFLIIHMYSSGDKQT